MTRRDSPLTRDEITRYSRHLLVPEIGAAGQRKLKAARIVCVGAGGLGSPVAMYLAGAGVGVLGLVDFDRVDVTNLHRQILYTTADVGRPKLEAASERLRAANPEIEIAVHEGPLTSANALDVLGRYDIVVDATDNFPARYLLSDACVLLGRPYVYGSVFRLEGQVSVFAARGGPCYRCLFPEAPAPGVVPSCSEAGVLGVVPGIVGTIQAAEAIKLAIGMPGTLAGRILVIDAQRMRFREVRLAPDPACPVCGTSPTIRSLIDYEAFCGTRRPGGSPGDLVDGGADDQITVAELRQRIQRGEAPVLIDVREDPELEIVSLPGTLRIRMAEITARSVDLPRDRDLVVFCRTDERSARAVAELRAAGVGRTCYLRGGILAWIAEVDPSLPRY